MAEIVEEWAGKERLFRLNFGLVLDLEEATGEAIGRIFMRVAGGSYRAADIYHTIRLALIGGGASIIDAKRLLEAHFDTRPYVENASLAGAILASLMVGVEGNESDEPAEPEKIRFSEVSQICREFNLSPQELRDMRYPDFVNMVRGFNAGSKRQAEHITDDEFMDILNRYEPEALQ
ncbi:gene transfer agent family protein [Pukyongiella litopenaei]|uniref:Uncharacterized protein n=1 Tax=Pukyongiella litopenaei TaxID=2605946 RepID=A0A2S0ML52_9RHOB|nr:gene transfer agent family protein [Pukyongiella litopenaei]AVO36596.1 hypothetical protein C6Y53_02030 [Pukyongiella litopenaei]